MNREKKIQRYMRIISQNDQRSPEARITRSRERGMGQSSRGRLRQGGGRGKSSSIHFVPSALSRPVRCSVPTGKRNPSRSENWHHWTTIYSHPRRPPSPTPREFLGISRLVTGGGDRVHFAISPTASHHIAPHQPPKREYTSSSRPRNFRRSMGEEGGGRRERRGTVSSASNAKIAPFPVSYGIVE